MEPSPRLSRTALALTLASSLFVACSSPNEEVDASEGAIATRALGEVAAVRVTETENGVARTRTIAMPDKVDEVLYATGVSENKRLVEGAPRCLPQGSPRVFEYLDARGSRLGEARFACPSDQDNTLPGTLRTGGKTFIVRGHDNALGAVLALPTVLGDSLYGITSINAVVSSRGVFVTDPWDVKGAVEAIGPRQELSVSAPQAAPACVADNTVIFFRGEQKVATVNVLCTIDGRPTADAKLLLEDGTRGMILVDPENLRDALGLK